MPINWFLINSFRNIIPLFWCVWSQVASRSVIIFSMINYDHLPSHRHRMVIITCHQASPPRDSSEREKRATLSVVKERNRPTHNSVMILTYALMNGEIQTRRAAFINSLSCRPRGLMWTPVCAFSKTVQLFWRPFIFFWSLCVGP